MKGDFMTKHKDTTTPSDPVIPGTAPSATGTVEQRVVAFAEQLGRIVGSVQGKAEGWLDNPTLHDQLTRIRDGAADLLDHLGSETTSVTGTAAQKQTARHPRERSTTATTAGRATVATGRSGGKVDAPGKSHRKPSPSTRGIKHSDEMIPKLKAAEITRHRRRG
jgi:hypothetical protein